MTNGANYKRGKLHHTPWHSDIRTSNQLNNAIGDLSQYNHDPSNVQMVALNPIFRYHNSTKYWPLRLGGALGASALKCYINSDYAGCPDDYKSTSGRVFTCGGAANWRSRQQTATAQSTTNAEYSAFGVGCIRLRLIPHLLNELGIRTILPAFSDSQSLITSIKKRIYRGTPVAHIATDYNSAADMARDGEIDLSYVLTAEMPADCFTKPLPKPAFLKQCATMGTIGIGLRNCLGMRGNGRGNCIGIANGIRTPVRK